MSNRKTYWYKVLRHYEKNGYYNNGLTIPFLIGCREIIEPQSKLQTVREFLYDLKDSQQPVTMMRCGGLKEYVIGLLDRETNSVRRMHSNLYREFGNLIITDGSFVDILIFDELISRLQADYGDRIRNRMYSKEFGKWGDFSPNDKTRLNEIKS